MISPLTNRFAGEPEPWKVSGQIFDGIYRVEHTPHDECQIKGWHLYRDCGLSKTDP